MEAKFTKGKWQINQMYNTTLSIHVKGLEVCDIDLCGPFDEDTGRLDPTQEELANANLITAAPEMYNKLKEMSGLLTSLDPLTHANIELDCQVCEIEQLLAKACGEIK